MKKFLFLFLISLTVLATSCQKEEILAGEKVAQKLQSVIKEKNIERVMNFELNRNWDDTSIFGDYGENYEFQGQFIYMEGKSYNLNNLIKYQIESINYETGEEVKFLLLSFY